MYAKSKEAGEEAGEVLEVVRGRAAVGVGDVEEAARGRDVEQVAEDGGDVAQVCCWGEGGVWWVGGLVS